MLRPSLSQALRALLLDGAVLEGMVVHRVERPQQLQAALIPQALYTMWHPADYDVLLSCEPETTLWLGVVDERQQPDLKLQLSAQQQPV